jgi:hypothetical protein
VGLAALALALGTLTPALVALTLLGACGQDNRVLVPNRVLDRPLDAVLACVRDSGTQIEVLSLNQCAGSNPGRCEIVDSPTPQLIGFLTNSERNELAMFRRCDREAALVDMDPEAPGYNLLPAGLLPSSLTITSDSCRVVSANAGSCDFTMLDVTGLGAYAVNTVLTGSDDEPAPEPPELPPPSSLVSTLVPRGSDGRPLAASPGEILAVPSALSLAGAASDPVGDEGGDDGADTGASDGFDPGSVDTGSNDDEGGTEPIPEGTVCDLTAPASVYVTFPACQLVAEVSLSTQSILQSRRFVTNAAGEVEVIDGGTTPVCPVDCPAQLDGEFADEVELVDPNGVFPRGMALVVPPAPNVEVDQAEQEVTYAALFVGGPGADAIYEIAIDDNGRFAPTTEVLPLEDSQGVQTIRVTPPADVLGDSHQFIYVIAGDGSTRVIDRDFDPGIVGVECDTQIDPTLEPPTACHPIDPGQAGNSIDRRPFAVGPGIRAPLGATINDWSFHKLTAQEARDTCGGGSDLAADSLEHTPFCSAGVVGVGVTSLGTVLYASFGQFSEDDTISPAVDPVGVMQAQLRPHSLWPSVDPFASNPQPEALPLVADEEPGRALPGGGSDAQTLSPSLRRIDLAYSAESGVSEEQVAVSAALGGVENVDQLGSLEGNALYENAAPRVAVRDYQQWSSQTWKLEWEGAIPGTTSTTGLLACDHHGGVDEQGNEVPGGTCRNTEPDDARLHDESANFCDDGVLPGDALVVLGCSGDDVCGLGQRCLLDPTAPTTASGICVSELAYENEREALRAACAPFIRDECGSAEREYRITRATDNELWLQALERPARSLVRSVLGPRSPTDATVDMREYTARLTCDSPVRRVEAEPCQQDADCLPDPYDPDNQRGGLSCDKSALPLQDEDPGPGVCVGQQPDGGCDDDEACVGLGAQYLCVDSVCRAPCDLCPPPTQPAAPCQIDDDCVDAEAGQVCIAGVCHEPCEGTNPSCLLSPLPGPRCFPELVRYTVRLNEAFSFSGSSTPFLSDRVVADPVTGECMEDEAVSSLLTSRIRLGPDSAATFGTDTWQIRDCVNPEEAGPDDPNPCRIVSERSADPYSLFHRFRYEDQPVAAIRFSNPLLSVTIDLTSLTGLTTEPPDFSGQTWPAAFAEFLRARIPSGYREEFATINGFIAFADGVVVGSTPLVYPVRILRAPEPNGDFIVDAGGRGGAAGVRGQVVRIDHAPGQVVTDQQFRVR